MRFTEHHRLELRLQVIIDTVTGKLPIGCLDTWSILAAR